MQWIKKLLNNLQKKIPTILKISKINTTQITNIVRNKLEMLIKNTKYSEVENRIQDMNGLVITTVIDTKIGEVEKKTPDFSVLVKKTDYNRKQTKTWDIAEKFVTTSDYNKFASDIPDSKIKKKGLACKSNSSSLVKNFDLNAKIATLATEAKLHA